MLMYKYNFFTRKYYMYDTDDHDILSEMFDDALHDNDIDPHVSNKLTCGYCGTRFLSRNRLFHHLGYMNIDISKIKRHTMDIDTSNGHGNGNGNGNGSGYDSDMGDFGFTLHMHDLHNMDVSRKKQRLKARRERRYRYLRHKAVIQKKDKASKQAIEQVIEELQAVALRSN